MLASVGSSSECRNGIICNNKARELIKILFELMSIHIKGWIKDENSNSFLLYSKETETQ